MANVTYDKNCLTVLDHPLVGHKMTILRDESTAPAHFRKLVHELAALEAYEATRDLPDAGAGENPILRNRGRAAQGRHLGRGSPFFVQAWACSRACFQLFRRPLWACSAWSETKRPTSHIPITQKCLGIENRMALVIDPMLATGGSALAAIKYLREAGVKDIRLLVMVAAPEGVAAVNAAEPDVHIWACALDEGLNDAAYIVPGLGDAGDRIFGTV